MRLYIVDPVAAPNPVWVMILDTDAKTAKVAFAGEPNWSDHTHHYKTYIDTYTKYAMKACVLKRFLKASLKARGRRSFLVEVPK